MKIVKNSDGYKFAVPTTRKEKVALQKLKYDLFDDYKNSLDWNVGNLEDEETAMRYMFWMYQDWYFRDNDTFNPELGWRPWGSGDTIDIEYKTSSMHDEGEYEFRCDTIGTWIPSNYMTLIAYYRMKGKFRKVAMILKKYGKESILPGLHL